MGRCNIDAYLLYVKIPPKNFQVFQNIWLSLIFILIKLTDVVLHSRLIVQANFYCFARNYVVFVSNLVVNCKNLSYVMLLGKFISFKILGFLSIELNTVHKPVTCLKWMARSILLNILRDLVDKNWSCHFAKACISFIPVNSSTLGLICLAPMLGYTSYSKAHFDCMHTYKGKIYANELCLLTFQWMCWLYLLACC